MAYPAISFSTATAGRHRCPQKRLQTARQPPVYPNSSPDHRACNSLTPFPCPRAVHRWIRAKTVVLVAQDLDAVIALGMPPAYRFAGELTRSETSKLSAPSYVVGGQDTDRDREDVFTDILCGLSSVPSTWSGTAETHRRLFAKTDGRCRCRTATGGSPDRSIAPPAPSDRPVPRIALTSGESDGCRP